MKSVLLALAVLRASPETPSCPPGMILVPGGAFTMGDPEGFPDEQPPLPLTV